jgi:hypothetical protein
MIGTIIALCILGVILYLIEAMLPMPAPIKLVIRVIIVLAMVVILLRLAGVFVAVP